MRLAVDTGGTHTDLIIMDERSGKLYVDKVPTTPKNLIIGIQRGIESILAQTGESHQSIREFCYATTLITNMIVQKESVKTGMLTTEGFRDILEIGRAYRNWNIYDIYMDKQEPLIPRYLRLGVRERIDFKGNIIEPLDEEGVIRAAERLVEEGVQSVAVVFLHSYRNPIHEKRAKEILQKNFPQLLVSLSSEVSPEFREYERASTTALNAYVQPKMIAHLTQLEDNLSRSGMKCRAFMMQCNGGLIGFPKVKKRPIMASSSGPVAGVLAGKFFANSRGMSDVITFDMGGTSTDISIIKDNQINFTIESELERYPIQIPMVEFITIGAGGGSIVWVDSGGSLRVGPKSAGADPGPACYDKGGKEPTTTDAMLLCGIINPNRFLGGRMLLEKDKARKAFEEKICRMLNLSWEKAAVFSIRVATANIVEGIKSVSVARGLDPRDFALVAFGGAGPMFASFVAAELDSPVIVIPPRPGIASAFGILTADVKADFVATKICIDEQISPLEMNSIYEELEAKAVRELQEELDGQEILISRSVDLRYFGQSFELNVPVPRKKLTADDIFSIRRAFFDKHKQAYGYFFENRPVQYVKLRVTAIIKKEAPDLLRMSLIDFEKGEPLVEKRRVFLPVGELEIPVYDRTRMLRGYVIEGPAIIEQMDSTTLLLPGDTGEVAPDGSLIIQRRR